jgi:hypothetical protein
MKHRLIVSCLVALAVPTLALAQVEKAAMRTTGISCGTCAFVSEIYLSRLPDIAEIKISKSQEAVMVTYKPGARFQPKELREALKKTDVGVTQFQISARGRVVDENGKRFFVAGGDRFLLTGTTAGPNVPSNVPILIEGIVNDLKDPMDVRVLTLKTLN